MPQHLFLRIVSGRITPPTATSDLSILPQYLFSSDILGYRLFLAVLQERERKIKIAPTTSDIPWVWYRSSVPCISLSAFQQGCPCYSRYVCVVMYPETMAVGDNCLILQ